MVTLFAGAIVYNVFFIQSAVRRQSAQGVIVGPDRLGSLVALVGGKGRTEKKKKSMVRVSVRPGGMRATPSANPVFTALVLAAQRDLAALGRYSGRADGRYDAATRAALIAYQKKNGLPVTGRPDQATLDRLRYERQLFRAAGYTASIRPVAKRDVVFAQRRLARLGYAPGEADGIPGARTRRAIRRFQADRGLPVTGRLDAAVMAALRR